MTARQHLVDQLIRGEGLRLKPYLDQPGGKITIGVGRNLSDKGITTSEAMWLLEHDIDEAIHDCATFPWFAGLDEIRQRVLIDMRFNLGPAGLRRFARMLAAVERKDYRKAAEEMIESAWATQVGGRATRLAQMMVSGTTETDT